MMNYAPRSEESPDRVRPSTTGGRDSRTALREPETHDYSFTVKQRKMFLVIEDNADDAALIRTAFDALDACSAFVCRNLSEAKAFLCGAGMYTDRATFPFPNAVICDLNLGGESGVEFVEWLTRSADLQNLPVIILTGSTSEEEISAAQTRGAVAVLKKPARIEDLRSMLSDLANKLCT